MNPVHIASGGFPSFQKSVGLAGGIVLVQNGVSLGISIEDPAEQFIEFRKNLEGLLHADIQVDIIVIGTAILGLSRQLVERFPRQLIEWHSIHSANSHSLLPLHNSWGIILVDFHCNSSV